MLSCLRRTAVLKDRRFMTPSRVEPDASALSDEHLRITCAKVQRQLGTTACVPSSGWTTRPRSVVARHDGLRRAGGRR